MQQFLAVCYQLDSNPAQSHAYSVPPAHPTYTGPSANIKRILEFVDLCFIVGDLGPRTTPFTDILEMRADTQVADKFKGMYTPLVLGLKATLRKHGTTHTLKPFRSLVSGIVLLYFAHKYTGCYPCNALS